MARLDWVAADGGSRGQSGSGYALGQTVRSATYPALSVLLPSGVPLSTGPATHIIPNPASKGGELGGEAGRGH